MKHQPAVFRQCVLAACLLALGLPSMAAAPDAKAAGATHAPAASASASASAPAHTSTAPFAVVGDTVISAADYQRALALAMRKKYYHAKPPEAEYARFQREVGDEVVNRALLLVEARRRGIQPDHQAIQATVAGYDAQYKSSPNWKRNRERMLAAVVPQLERDSVLERLEQLVRLGADPSEADARAYYERNRALFVEPEQVKLAVILLKVDPSSRQAVWNSAMAEGKAIHQKLLAGADFAELARLHSGDRSASRGGEMDYTHRGMLPEAVHAVVDKLKPKQLAEPVQLLEGVAILRLDGRRPATQREFAQVQARAADLWRREQSDARWKQLIDALRKGADIRIDESQYVPLRATGDRPRTG